MHRSTAFGDLPLDQFFESPIVKICLKLMVISSLAYQQVLAGMAGGVVTCAYCYVFNKGNLAEGILCPPG